MDRITSMEIFIAVVELGGFTAAAQARAISPTMVSNHIKMLEEHLGAKLLNRTTRRQSITEIGADYFAQCLDIIARVDAAETAAREMVAKPRGRLRISAPVTLGSHFLVPAFADYLDLYPEVGIDFHLNDRVIDLADEGFDAALRFGNLPDSGLIARQLMPLTRIICASPEYLAKHGTPQRPEDLADHNCLAFHSTSPELNWPIQGSDGKSTRISGHLTINNGPALLRAALAGIGIVMLPDYMLAEDIETGKLVRLFPGHDFPSPPLQLVYLPDRNMTPKLRSFVDFILHRFGRSA